MITTSTNNNSEKIFSKFKDYINSDSFIQDMKNIIGVERSIVKSERLTTHKQVIKKIYNDDLDYSQYNSSFVYNFNDHHIYITKKVHETSEIKLFSRNFLGYESLKNKWLKTIKYSSDYDDNSLVNVIKDYFVSDFDNIQTKLYQEKLNKTDTNTFLLEKNKLNYATFSIEEFKRTFNLDNINNSLSSFEEMNNWDNDLLHMLLNQQHIDLELLKLIDKIKVIAVKNKTLIFNFAKGTQKDFTVLVNSMMDNNYIGQGLLALLLDYIDSVYGTCDDNFMEHEQFIQLLQNFGSISILAFKKLLLTEGYQTKRMLKKLLTLDAISHGYMSKSHILQIFEKTAGVKDFYKYYNTKSDYTGHIGYLIDLLKNNLLYFDPEITGNKVYDCIAYIEINYPYNNKKPLINKLLTLV